jgi:hypothetical protein
MSSRIKLCSGADAVKKFKLAGWVVAGRLVLMLCL